MEIIANHIKKSEDGAVVFLAHSSELCEQAYQCFIEVWQYLADRPLKAVRCWGSHPVPSAYEKSMFIVGGFQKVHSILRKDENAFGMLQDRIGLIVVDEHKSRRTNIQSSHSEVDGHEHASDWANSYTGRTEMEETAEMSEFFFQSKVNITTETGTSEIEMLKQRKVLAQIDYIPIQSPIDIELTASQKRSLEKTFDFPKGFLNQVASSNVRNIEIMKKLILSCKEDRKILFSLAMSSTPSSLCPC